MSQTDRQNEKALSSRNTTVTVACKLPHGLVIRDFMATKVEETMLGGMTRTVTVHRPVGNAIRLKGPTVPPLMIRSVEVVGGYAITEGIDGKVFANWLDANKDAPYIRNELIYGHEDGARVRAWAKDHASVRSGFEPIDTSMRSEAGRMVYSDKRVRAATDNMLKVGVSLDVKAA